MSLDRRTVLALGLGALASPAFAQSMSRITAYAFTFAGLKGGDLRLADMRASRSSSSTRRRSAVTRRNMSACSSCGRAIASAAW